VPHADHTARRLKLFGGNLRRERTARQFTQEKLAEMADLNVRTVRKIEAGETNILITTLDRLRRALGCSSDALMGK
jgi:transcriptional regulator with XRE-family HTH domain